MFRFEREILLEAEPRFVHRYKVRFIDTDGDGAVFFPRLLDACLDAFLEFLAKHGLAIDGKRGFALDNGFGTPLTHAEIDCLHPVYFGDELDVSIVAAHFERHLITLGYRVVRIGTVEAVASCQIAHAFVDWTTFRPIEPPATVRALFERLPRSDG